MNSRYSRFGGMIVVLVSCGTGLASSLIDVPQPSWEITLDANIVTIQTGGTPLLTYRYGDVSFKPYFKELFTPGGVNALLDSPPDHVHHHGLMLACEVDKIDFWGEVAGQTPLGRQGHRRFSDVAVSGLPDCHWASFAESISWYPETGSDPVLSERRTVIAGRAGQPAATLLRWKSELAVPGDKGSVVLSGSHYHGLGMRFIRSMDNDGEFRNPDNDPGVIFRGEERLLRSRWCAYTAKADGRLVTVAMFDHPHNPRHPATWFTMAEPFAYMSATMRLHEEPLEIMRGDTLVLHYAVVLWDERPETPQIDDLYSLWVATPIGR